MAALGGERGDRRARHRAPVRRPARAARAALALAAGLVALGLVGGVAVLTGTARDLPDGSAGGAVAGALRSPTAAQAAPVAEAERVAALQALLDERAAALLARDRRGWLTGLAGSGTARGADAAALAFAARQGQVFDRLAAVPLEEWAWEYVGAGPDLTPQRAARLPAGSWVAEVSLAYRMGGLEGAPVRRQQHLTVVPSQGGWLLGTDADASTAPDLWDVGPVAVVRSERALLVGTAEAEVLQEYAPMVDAAAERVDAVWGTGWPRTTLFQVPATQEELAALLGRSDERGLEQIAAVTTGELVGGDGATHGDHVVINPEGFALLAPLGQGVVLTHELTHVATRAGAVRGVPLWLSEGFADWVAYAGTGLPPEVVAAELLDRVREDGAPTHLPAEDDFDPARTDVGPAYSGAWLAVELLAQRRGPEALVALYRSAATDPAGPDLDDEEALDGALTGALGLDREDLLEAWRAHLEDLAEESAAAGRDQR